MFTNVTITFLVLMIPVAGFIAWLGDRIGHKSGKKRHSLFGLRPRHTAMLFTIGSGVGIGVVSFLLMYAVSQTFRVVVRDGAVLYERNRELKWANENQATLLSQTRAKAKQSQTDAEVSRGEAVQAFADQKAAIAARDTAQDLYRAAQTQAQTASTRLKTADDQLAAQKQKLTNEQNKLSSVQSSLQDKTARIAGAETKIDALGARVRAALIEVKQAEARQKSAQKEMLAAQSKLQHTRATAQAVLLEQKRQQERTLAGLKESLSQLTKEAIDQKSKTETERQELARVTQELTLRRNELNQLIASADALRRNQITFHVGEEVARVSIKPGYSVWRIEAILDSFLSAAAKKAEGRGARKSDDRKESRAVFLFPLPAMGTAASVPTRNGLLLVGQTAPPKGGPNVAPQEVSEQDVLQSAATAIRKANEDVVVVALASTNAVAGEPVAVQLKTYRNPVVLEANTIVAETVVDGFAPRDTVADALYTFLRRDVRKKLLDAGIIPPQSGGESALGGEISPAQASPSRLSANGNDAIVSLSGNEWLQIMDDIKQAGARARVIVRTAQTLRAGDPVALRFEVRDLQTSGSIRPSW